MEKEYNEFLEAAKNAARELLHCLDQLEEEDFDDDLIQLLNDIEYRID